MTTHRIDHTLVLTPVRTRAERAALFDFTRALYRGDPAWVAPLEVWLSRRLRPGNPLFEEADFELLAARRDGRIVGTVSALHDRRHQRHRGEAVCFFGFFEATDEAVAHALLEAAAERARAWGCTVLRGPRNLSRIEETGALLEGFDARPPMLASHHKPEYHTWIAAAGFRKHHDVLAYHIALNDLDGRPRALPEKLERQAAAVNLDGLEVRSVEWAHVRRDLALAHEVFVEGFRDVPENTPMPRRQFVRFGLAFLAASNRHMLKLATIRGRAAGFALCFPELNEAIARCGGRLGPRGASRLLRGLRQVETASFKLLGVLPEHRHTGLHALLIREAIAGVREAGYRRLEASLVDERNGAMRHIVESAGMEVYKRYRVFERELPAAAGVAG